MDNPQETLMQYAERASRYAINLQGRILKTNRVNPHGGNAIVFQGTLQPDGTRVAIKTPRGGPPSDEGTIKRILEEVHICSKVNHENILRVLGITTEFDCAVSIVSPWMDNGDAHNYAKNTAIDPGPLMTDIARGLQYLHTRQEGAVFHGDLKGWACPSGRLWPFFLVDSTFSISVSHQTGGTLRWTAPEILLDEGEKSAAADIWSFGMTLLELFMREVPFHELKHSGIYTTMLAKKIPDRPNHEKTCSRLTGDWWAICLECWKFGLVSRPSIARILQVLTNIQWYAPPWFTSPPLLTKPRR
ncbi:kinase-like domain-containing protein [Pisolithus marmoratus]|nr:kinase-like domain-containing protein [Pisolithus marmoratus]